MTQTYMKAPIDSGKEATILGFQYNIPKDKVIKVMHSDHSEILKRHGFTDYFPPLKNVDEVIEEMDDKDELVTFIEERGGTADSDMSLKKLKKLAKEVSSEG